MYKVVAALNDTKSAFTVISEVSENVSKSTFTVYSSSLHLKKYSMLESDYFCVYELNHPKIFQYTFVSDKNQLFGFKEEYHNPTRDMARYS